MLVNSKPFETGKKAPEFKLKDTVSGNILSYNDLKGEKGTVVMFICNHCPFVLHVNEQLVKRANDYRDKGSGWSASSSNDPINYPQDGPDKMQLHAKKIGYPFPYLFDETQDIAKAYDAACTPDFYVFDQYASCVYHGQLDSSRPGNNIPVTGDDIRHVLDSIISDNPVQIEAKPSIGCNIKWK